MSLRIVDRYHSQQRQREQELIDSGQLRKVDELALLEPEQMRPLALVSVWMLLVGGIFFLVLNIASYYWQTGKFIADVTLGSVIWLIVLNLFGYVVILLIHELIHGIMFAFWGGHPHFGAKLPLALYCGARQQLFRRNHYLVVGLAPLLVITTIGIIVTVLYPGVSAYLWFAWVGNFSGAAGDVWVAKRMWHLSDQVVVEDTETGYTAWELPIV